MVIPGGGRHENWDSSCPQSMLLEPAYQHDMQIEKSLRKHSPVTKIAEQRTLAEL